MDNVFAALNPVNFAAYLSAVHLNFHYFCHTFQRFGGISACSTANSAKSSALNFTTDCMRCSCCGSGPITRCIKSNACVDWLQQNHSNSLFLVLFSRSWYKKVWMHRLTGERSILLGTGFFPSIHPCLLALLAKDWNITHPLTHLWPSAHKVAGGGGHQSCG